jgi:hypothetical protein
MPTEDPKATILAQDPFLEIIDLVADKHQIRIDAICEVHAQIDELKACGFNIK